MSNQLLDNERISKRASWQLLLSFELDLDFQDCFYYENVERANNLSTDCYTLITESIGKHLIYVVQRTKVNHFDALLVTIGFAKVFLR